jgi:general secretion pathway protein D
LLLAALLTLVGAVAASAAQPPTVGLLPAEAQIRVGQTIDVSAVVQGVSGLFGIDVRLSFNPAVLQVVDADAATPGVQATPGQCPHPDFVAKNEADNGAGTVWYAVTQLRPREPFSGSGTILTVRFKAKAGGTSMVTLSSVQLVDANGLEIQRTITSGSQIVVPATPPEIPEPGALVLLISGLGALAGYTSLRWAHQRGTSRGR